MLRPDDYFTAPLDDESKFSDRAAVSASKAARRPDPALRADNDTLSAQTALARENLTRLKEHARRRGRNRNAHMHAIEKRRKQAEAIREITNAKPLTVSLLDFTDSPPSLPTVGG